MALWLAATGAAGAGTIEVPEDFAAYSLISATDLGENRLLVVSDRKSSTRTSYTARLVDCAGRMAAPLAGGTDLATVGQEAEAALAGEVELFPLVKTGLDVITWRVAAHACRVALDIEIEHE